MSATSRRRKKKLKGKKSKIYTLEGCYYFFSSRVKSWLCFNPENREWQIPRQPPWEHRPTYKKDSPYAKTNKLTIFMQTDEMWHKEVALLEKGLELCKEKAYRSKVAEAMEKIDEYLAKGWRMDHGGVMFTFTDDRPYEVNLKVNDYWGRVPNQKWTIIGSWLLTKWVQNEKINLGKGRV